MNMNSFVAFFYSVSREEVETGNLQPIKKIIKNWERMGKGAFQNGIITFDGFDDTADEIYEIEPIRKYVQKLFRHCPHLLYFTNIELSGHILLPCYVQNFSVFYVGQQTKSIKEYHSLGIDPNLLPPKQIDMKFSKDEFNLLMNGLKIYGHKSKDKEGAKKIMNYLDNKFSQDGVK